MIAEAFDRTRSWLMMRALRLYLAGEGTDVLNIIKGREAIAAGRTTTWTTCSARSTRSCAAMSPEAKVRFRFSNTSGNEYVRSEEHTSELQSLMRISYAVFCLKKKNNT